MACSVVASPALSPEVVDARFWELVGREEGWLDAEFAEAAAEPAESEAPTRPRFLVAVERDRPRSDRPAGGTARNGRPSDEGDVDGRLSRQRSPPAGTGVSGRITCRRGGPIVQSREPATFVRLSNSLVTDHGANRSKEGVRLSLELY
jgi:hypothetical protein